MKVEKLLTLSQFVNLVTSNTGDEYDYYTNLEIIGQSNRSGISCGAIIAIKIADYNNFLKQPLTKEMFINPIEKPLESSFTDKTGFDSDHFKCAFEAWELSEDEVIFDNYKKSIHQRFSFIDGLFEISFANAGYPKLYCNGGSVTTQTLHDLAEATSGELTIKNVTI